MNYGRMTIARRLQGTPEGMAITLLALGRTAERAAHLPFAVRFIVLAILRHAEYISWTVFAGMSDFVPEALQYQPSGDNDPAAAFELALRFELMATILTMIGREPVEYPDQDARIDQVLWLSGQLASAVCAARTGSLLRHAPAFADTS